MAIGLVYLAVAWAWIGPPMIRHHETDTVDRLLRQLNTVVPNETELRRLADVVQRRRVFANVGYVFIAFWVIYVIRTVIINLGDFVSGFGVQPGEIWWYGVLAGVAIFAYYTGLLTMFGLRPLVLTFKLLNTGIRIYPYHVDFTGGLRFVGRFVSRTSWLVASGLFFVPLAVKISSRQLPNRDFSVIFIPVLYLFGFVISVVVPAYFMHRKLISGKKRIADQIKSQIAELVTVTDDVPYVHSVAEYQWRRDFLVDLQRVRDWPFNFGGLVTAFIQPALAALLTVATNLPQVEIFLKALLRSVFN